MIISYLVETRVCPFYKSGVKTRSRMVCHAVVRFFQSASKEYILPSHDVLVDDII